MEARLMKALMAKNNQFFTQKDLRKPLNMG